MRLLSVVVIHVKVDVLSPCICCVLLTCLLSFILFLPLQFGLKAAAINISMLTVDQMELVEHETELKGD